MEVNIYVGRRNTGCLWKCRNKRGNGIEYRKTLLKTIRATGQVTSGNGDDKEVIHTYKEVVLIILTFLVIINSLLHLFLLAYNGIILL